MALVSHLRLTWGGTLGSGASAPEAWSTGLSLGEPLGQTALLPDAAFQAIANRVQAFHTSAESLIGSDCRLTDVRLALVGQDGRVARNADGSYAQLKKTIVGGVAGGTGSGPLHPFQVSLVATLDTAFPGRQGRGRMFLPMPRATVTSDGLIAASDAQVVAGAVTDLINAIHGDVGNLSATQERVVVASSGSQLQSIPPANHPVTRVRVGHVLDTMRSRRRSLVEAYSLSGRAIS